MAQPMPPCADNTIQKVPDSAPVASAVVIPVVAQELLPEDFLLRLEGRMAVGLAPFEDAPDGSSKAVRCCSHPHKPLAAETLAPVDGEAEKIEGTGPVRSSISPPARTMKRHQPRLVRMQRQSVHAESLREHGHDAAGFFLGLKQHHGIVRVAHKGGATLRSRPYYLGKPHVQDRMQEDVRQNRRDDAALRRTALAAAQRAVLHHPCIQPLVDQSQDHSVTYPAAQHFAQLAVIDRVEILAYVDLDDPAAGHPHRLAMQRVERLMRRSLWPKAVRAVEKFLLVDRFQHH